MAGWALFAGIALAAAVLLAVIRFPRGLALFAGAAAMLGAAGYAWQGNPSYAGRPVAAQRALRPADDEGIAPRNAMFGRYGASAAVLIPADAMQRIGADEAAVGLIRSGLRREPGNVALWTQLGTIIAAHDRTVSPAANVAFRHAIALAPGDPAPLFFLGQAQVRNGDFVGARQSWMQARSMNSTAGYRAIIDQRLTLLDVYLTSQRPDPVTK